MVAVPTRQTVEAARTDPAVFAQALVGQPLWPHQFEVVRSDARVRVICSGRQAGKSRTLAILALHQAFAVPESRTLILSAGEDVARELLAEIALLASAPLLTGSVVDENVAQVTLSNGSTVISVPASQRQVRSRSIDLLILDEASFMDESLWTAARFTIIARPESRVVMASTPYGRADQFFATSFRAGNGAVAGYQSFHWPSTASPLVDTELLDLWRKTSTAREYAREVLAEWTDDTGAYFSAAELSGATEDYDLIPPEEGLNRQVETAGVDWGFARDSHAVALIAQCSTFWDDGDEDGYLVPWLEEQPNMTYSAFVDRLVRIGDPHQDGFAIRRFMSETNGVGAAPTQSLQAQVRQGMVEPVHTNNQLKEDGFGRLKILMEQGLLLLPRHPGLLRQLAALEFETTETGSVRIAVPERSGHDDLAMALVLGVHGLREQRRSSFTIPFDSARAALEAEQSVMRIEW